MRVAVLEFVLEGLHLGKRLNKTALDGSAVYGGWTRADRPFDAASVR